MRHPLLRQLLVRGGVTATLMALLPQAHHAPHAQGPAVTVPLVFVSRQIPDQGSLYWSVPKAQPGVGPHSRFRPAAPGRLLVREVDGSLRTLVDGNAPGPATLELIDVNAPDVSYDGQWIAFAGLRSGVGYPTGPGANPSAWRIYVIRANGTDLTEVTIDEVRTDLPAALVPYDDTDPVWLPDGRLVFASTRYPSFAQYGGVRTSNLWVVSANGTGLHRITAERNGAERPLIDPVTGKIVFARWWRNHRFALDDLGTIADPGGGFQRKDGLSADRNVELDGAPTFVDYLYRNVWQATTINPDGSGLTLWSGAFTVGEAPYEERNAMYGGAFASDGTLYANFFPMYNMTDASGFGGIRRLSRGASRATGLAGVTALSVDYLNPAPPSYGIFAGPYVTEPEVLPDGRLLVSVAPDINQDYGLATMNADGTGLQPLVDLPGTTELRARAIRARVVPPILGDAFTHVAAARPPGETPPFAVDGTFDYDAQNVYYNAPVDMDIVSAPAVGSAQTLRFFIDHQRASPGSFPNLDWPVLVAEQAVAPGGDVRNPSAPASLPLFTQIRSGSRVPLTGGPVRDGAAHEAGMNYAPMGSTLRCVGCHTGHSLIPLPATANDAKWTNLAPGATITVSSTRDASANGGLVDRRVIKGTTFNYWTSAPGQTTNQSATLTFAVPIKVKTVRLYNPRAGGDASSSIAVQDATVRLYSDAAATQLVTTQAAGALSVGGTDVEFKPTLVARAVRVELGAVSGTFAGAPATGLAEIEVIASGDLNATPLDPTADEDGDGMPNGWEIQYGLNPYDPSDANGDADGDGVPNHEEYTSGSHPEGAFVRYFAEGSTSAFFNTTLALLNPGDLAANIVLRFQKADATTASHSVTLAAHSRTTILPGDYLDVGQTDFSTVIESDRIIVADRTMDWADGQAYGSHAESSVESPSLTWYFAEGATHGQFDLFYLLQNPNDQAAVIRIRYLRPASAPIEKTYVVAAQSRQTIWVDDELFDAPGTGPRKLLAEDEVSAVIEVTNGQPIIAERAMYLSRDGQSFTAGHDSAGVTAPALRWFLAEGATGPFFDQFVLLANPTGTPATARVTYLLPGGATYSTLHDVAANSRSSIFVGAETFDSAPGQHPLAQATLSTIVESTNAVPLIVERAMWWPSVAFGNVWTEGHNSPGATETGHVWALAGGEVGGPRETATYILLANTSPFAGAARVTLMLENGQMLDRDQPLAPNSRVTVDTSEFPEAVGRRFGAVITSLATTASGPPELVVERAMYSNANGIVWAAGTNVLATKLPNP